MEIEPLRTSGGLPAGVEIVVSGIGPFRTAFNTARYVERHKPSMVILAGIAGAYSGCGLSVGESVLVSAETCADLGSFAGETFTPKFSERYTCPHIPTESSFATAESYSVNAAGAPFIAGGALLENMEGVAFFYACTQMRVPFLELRTISNRVGTDSAEWNIPLAAEWLAEALKQLLYEIGA